jgi:hypothetical protein
MIHFWYGCCAGFAIGVVTMLLFVVGWLMCACATREETLGPPQ